MGGIRRIPNVRRWNNLCIWGGRCAPEKACVCYEIYTHVKNACVCSEIYALLWKKLMCILQRYVICAHVGKMHVCVMKYMLLCETTCVYCEICALV